MKRILVVGSINMDVVTHVKSHPRPGETVLGLGTEFNSGGKGANQAVAAARAGGGVTLVGAVGTDAFGPRLVAGLQSAGVATDHVHAREGTSGMAFIAVAESGENNIILSAGTNAAVTCADVDAALADGSVFAAVLVQNEISWDTTVHALRRGRELGLRTFLNPAPARAVEPEVLRLVDVLVVNETEAQASTGVSVVDVDTAEQAAARLVAGGASTVVITLGAKGSVCCLAGGRTIHTPAFPVQPVDTTAAGDTFVGALAQALAEGMEMDQGLRFATAASAITVTRRGAQPSIPLRHEIDAFLDNVQR